MLEHKVWHSVDYKVYKVAKNTIACFDAEYNSSCLQDYRQLGLVVAPWLWFSADIKVTG